ncbi:MAG: adenylate kinase [Bacteroidia bacterium]|nr:adenylate kinase [Bacteroidia bacterium]
MLNLILFGPPGSGKGTQSVRLGKKYNLIHLSTGDMLRSQIAKGTELGLAAKAIMDRGELVSDKIVIGMIEKQIEENPSADGFIFDGFPRTTIQAISLDELLEKHGTHIAATLSLEVSNEELVVRLIERGKESGRADDRNETVIQNRINEYNVKTSPLIEYYKSEGKYKPVAGMGDIEAVFELLCHEIDHLDAGEAHGEGVLEAHQDHHQTNQKSKNKKHIKNQKLMLHEENNDQHNHGHHNDEHQDEKHAHENKDEHHDNHDDHKKDENHDEKHHDDNHGQAQHEEKHHEEKHVAPKPVKAKPAAKKKAAPAKKKAAAPAKKKAAPAKKKVAKKKPAPKKKAAPKKKTAKKSAPKKAGKKAAKKSAPKKKGAKKSAPKKKAAPKKKTAKKSNKTKSKKRK